jgi:dTDP-4-dehydrorhamnose 3,5-epimerase
VPELISGDIFNDHRGSLISYNTFNMQEVKRMYMICPVSNKVIRAWQAHKMEKKWFFCVSGAFHVKLIKVDDFENPSSSLSSTSYTLQSSAHQVLCIPGGFANGFQALESGSELIVFSNFSLEESKKDNYRFEQCFWNVWED